MSNWEDLSRLIPQLEFKPGIFGLPMLTLIRKKPKKLEVRESDISGRPMYELDLPLDAAIRLNFTDGSIVYPFSVNTFTRAQYLEWEKREQEEAK